MRSHVITSAGKRVPLSKRESQALERVLQSVSRHYGFTDEDLTGRSMRPDLVKARQVALYLLHDFYGLASTVVGSMMNRDHTTVLHAKTIVERKGWEKEARSLITI